MRVVAREKKGRKTDGCEQLNQEATRTLTRARDLLRCASGNALARALPAGSSATAPTCTSFLLQILTLKMFVLQSNEQNNFYLTQNIRLLCQQLALKAQRRR
jgi:hypothetical protein